MTEYRTALSNQRLVAESIDLTSQEFLETTSKLDDSQFLAQAFALDYTFSGGALLSIEKGLVDMAGLAIKAGDYLDMEERVNLIDNLFATKRGPFEISLTKYLFPKCLPR